MARTNLHELATRLLAGIDREARNKTFEGKLRSVAADAGLNSVRSAEAVKLLEEIGRIEVVQRGRRGRDTIIKVLSDEPVTLDDAEAALPSRTPKRNGRLDYDNLGREVVERLIVLAREEALRDAQVQAFAAEAAASRAKIERLETELESAQGRETDLRIRLKAAEDALARGEENLRRAFGGPKSDKAPTQIPDDDARAVLDILRSGRS